MNFSTDINLFLSTLARIRDNAIKFVPQLKFH